MKKILLFLALTLIGVPAITFAGSGSAFLPHWAAAYQNDSTNANYQLSYIYISNITDHDLTVTVTAYGYNGASVTPTIGSGFSNNGTTLLAHHSGYVYLFDPGWNWGYAKISWSNIPGGGDDAVGLVAHGIRKMPTDMSMGSISVPIHDGVPF